MFGLLRLSVLLLLAFAVGWIVASQMAASACTQLGGVMRDQVCRGIAL